MTYADLKKFTNAPPLNVNLPRVVRVTNMVLKNRGPLRPTPAAEIEAIVRNLPGGLRSRRGVRLRPMPADSIEPQASKIGGLPWWPVEESWPKSGDHNCTLLVQLRRDEFPEIAFPDEADLLQILWAPYFPDFSNGQFTPDPIVFWRPETEDVNVISGVPRLNNPGSGLIPESCELHPERIDDFPGGEELLLMLPQSQVMALLEQAGAIEKIMEICAPGSKVAGYAHWLQPGRNPTCACGHEMELFLTLASWEYDSRTMWQYADDDTWLRSVQHAPGWISGLRIGDAGYLYFFYCSFCPARPVRMVAQSA
jgi:Domain of unknown function (DUF1963)